jgi:hypothetical protein
MRDVTLAGNGQILCGLCNGMFLEHVWSVDLSILFTLKKSLVHVEIGRIDTLFYSVQSCR